MVDTITNAIRAVVTDAVRDAMAGQRQPIQREALTIAETAEALGRSSDWVRSMIAAGHIPARTAGEKCAVLIPLPALRAWLANSEATS